MKDHRGTSYYAAMQRRTDLRVATYFEADMVKEFCSIFNVKEMRVSIRNGALAEPTKGFYAFKHFHSLYRMGKKVMLECDVPAYDVHCFDHVSVTPPNEGDDVFLE